MLRNSKTRFCETRFELFSSRAIIVCVGEVLKCRVVEVRSRTTSNVVRDPSEESKAETRDAEKNNQARTAVVVVVCLFFSLVLLLSFGSRVSRLGVDPTVTQRAARHPVGPREREKKTKHPKTTTKDNHDTSHDNDAPFVVSQRPIDACTDQQSGYPVASCGVDSVCSIAGVAVRKRQQWVW